MPNHNDAVLYQVNLELAGLGSIPVMLDVANNINQLQINKNYLEQTKPIYRFTMRITDLLADLINNSPDLKLLMSIHVNSKKHGADINATTKDDVHDILHLNRVMIKPLTYTKYQAVDKPPNYNVGDLLDTENRNSVDFFIEGIEYDHLKLNENFVNISLKDTDVETAINILYNQSGSKCKFFNFTKPDNVKIYKQIFVPPMKFTEAILFLENNYGIYKSSAIVFQDNVTLHMKPSQKMIRSSSDKFINPVNLSVINRHNTEKKDPIFSTGNSLNYYGDVVINNFTDEKIRILGNKLVIIDEASASISGDLYKREELRLDHMFEKFMNNKLGQKENVITNVKRNRALFSENYVSKFKEALITTGFMFTNPVELIFNPETFFNIIFDKDDYKLYDGLWGVRENILLYAKEGVDFQCNVFVSSYKIL